MFLLDSLYSNQINLLHITSDCTHLHDTLLDERRRVVDQDNEGLRLDELVHHLLQHEVRQQQQDAPQKIIEATADQHQAVLSAGPEEHNFSEELLCMDS